MDKKRMLESLISHYDNGTSARFAARLGVSPQTVNGWLSRRSFNAEKIYSKCLDVSAEWLLTGEGDMIKKSMPVLAASDGSVALNGSNNMNVIAGNEAAILTEKVKHLEAMLAEKERLINVLLERK